jgi:hypothetical protein
MHPLGVRLAPRTPFIGTMPNDRGRSPLSSSAPGIHASHTKGPRGHREATPIPFPSQRNGSRITLIILADPGHSITKASAQRILDQIGS